MRSIGYLNYKATLMVAFLKLMIKNPAASNCPQRTIFVVLQQYKTTSSLSDALPPYPLF